MGSFIHRGILMVAVQVVSSHTVSLFLTHQPEKQINFWFIMGIQWKHA